MNKAHLMVAAFSLVMGSILLLPALNIAFAQYSGQGTPGASTLEEQLQLAKEKITNAQQQGAYGSGTAMFGSNLDSTVLTIVVIVVIMGAISGAFFAAGKTGKKAIVSAGSDGSYTTGKFCTNCGTQLGDNQKFCGNCGTKA